MFQQTLKTTIGLIACLATTWALAVVDVNTGSATDLASIKGIGPSVSNAIVSEREAGQFKDWADFVERVKGIGDARAARLSAAGLTVNDIPLKQEE